ncbi:lytic transglycosylase domain-containing protein [Flavobacteriaceae bacterium]|nr:lytic transglycosylase domain-containing protein [Flavobacteriaceae bacterium]
MKPVRFFTLFFCSIFLIGLSFFSFERINSSFIISYGEPSTYKVHALHIPSQVEFAGEIMQLDEADLVERMDKELLVNTYWQSNTLLMMKRANKFFPEIERILKEEEVPDDFKYLALIESGLENLRSPAGAKGFWQILRTTGKEYGLEVNANVDERYHLELSTRMACAYLKKAKDRLGSWTLAAASYNRGIAGINRILDKQQADNYYDLLLGTETKRYIFRILAVKEIIQAPERFGFFVEKAQLYSPVAYRTIPVDTAITNIARFSEQMGVSYKTLKIYNPWLLQNHLNNKSRKLYHIALPIETGP